MDPVILFFGGFAFFILWRLFAVLGSRTGHEQRPDLEGVQRPARPSAPKNEAPPAAQPERRLAPVSPAAASLREADADFDEKAFIDGARAAYEMIVEAFAAGDLKSVRRFLGQSVYDAFKAAVAEREAAGRTSELKFVGIDDARIVSSQTDADRMLAVVDFTSNQVRVVRDKDGAVVEGDPNRIELVRDRWTFSRKTRSADPNWTLEATGAA